MASHSPPKLSPSSKLGLHEDYEEDFEDSPVKVPKALISSDSSGAASGTKKINSQSPGFPEADDGGYSERFSPLLQTRHVSYSSLGEHGASAKEEVP